MGVLYCCGTFAGFVQAQQDKTLVKLIARERKHNWDCLFMKFELYFSGDYKLLACSQLLYRIANLGCVNVKSWQVLHCLDYWCKCCAAWTAAWTAVCGNFGGRCTAWGLFV